MEFNEFSWERETPPSRGAALSAADVESIARLMAELRDLTQSRRTYTAASEFLRRFGYETDTSSLVRPETLSN